MQSTATTVAAYINEQPETRRAALEHLRSLCLEVLEGYNETMTSGMPCYTRPGEPEPEISFASQKQYISFYVLRQPVMDANRHLLAGLSVGKGCIRYANTAKINFGVIRTLLTESRASASPIC